MGLLDHVLSVPSAPVQERPSTVARLGLSDVAVDARFLIYDRTKGAGHKPAVEDSEDLQRILALPRRPRPTVPEQAAMAAAMTAWLRRDRGGKPCDCALLNPTAVARGISPCITELNPIQGWYLYEARLYGGCIGFILVGGGKTGIDILIPMVLPTCRVYVLLLPPELVDQFRLDFQLWSQHFRTPNLAGSTGPFDPSLPTLRVLKYSELQRPEFATWLATMKPDAVGCDEAQALKDIESVRGNRYVRFYEEHGDPCPERPEGVRAFHHSGSLTTRGLEDYSHLSALSLREGSPVPLEPNAVASWGLAINPAIGRAPAPMGALRHLCNPGERLRDGFRRRLVETPGVITTEDSDLNVALKIIKRPLTLPAELDKVLRETRERERRPDGEELVEKVEVAKVCRQLAAGFYYKWRYPDVRDASGAQIPNGKDCPMCADGIGVVCARCSTTLLWFSRRQAWFREQREKLEHRSDLLDSPKLIEDAARRCYDIDAGELGEGPKWASATYRPWVEVRDRIVPVKQTVWLDDFMAKDAAAWAKEAPGVVWFWHTALGERLSAMTGLPCYWGKTRVDNLNPLPEMVEARRGLQRLKQWKENAASWLGVETGRRSILVSLKAFHRGINLQSFNRMLYTYSPSDGGMWEQSLGRPHRFGQQASAVLAFVYRHTPEVCAALDDAKEYAKYTHETTGKNEKLLYAIYEGM